LNVQELYEHSRHPGRKKKSLCTYLNDVEVTNRECLRNDSFSLSIKANE